MGFAYSLGWTKSNEPFTQGKEIYQGLANWWAKLSTRPSSVDYTVYRGVRNLPLTKDMVYEITGVRRFSTRKADLAMNGDGLDIKNNSLENNESLINRSLKLTNQ